MNASILAIETFLPASIITIADLARDFPDWSVDRIASKTGIDQRHIASPHDTASTLALKAAHKLFASGVCSPADIDSILLCTQSPEYALPTTCLLQERLGIPKDAGALDSISAARDASMA